MRRVARLLAVVMLAAPLMVTAACERHTEPLGVSLQRVAGPHYEVIFDPATGIYTVEPV